MHSSLKALLITLQIDARFVQGRLIVRELAFGLGQGRLEGPRIDLEQQIALVNDLPFG